MRGKIRIKTRGGRKEKIKVRYMVTAILIGVVAAQFSSGAKSKVAEAVGCPDLRVVFARGSGGERWTDRNYLAFKAGIENKLKTVDLDYEFIDLDYPAVGVGIDNLNVTLGALFGTGDAYEFGESVKSGVKKLDKMVNGGECTNTKYVLGGYSQGAMVVSRALRSLKADRVIYAATFGDPKIYLPEGAGVIPAACRGGDLSDYRMYVPDCRAYKGLLGSYVPYEPETFAGKVGTWCNKRDIFCSSYLNMSDHTAYVAENLYEDASRVIFDKITKAFGLENHVSSPHDTAILIDSTGSMAGMIDQYKAEALRLATETLESGGRVALFDYRDLDDPYDLRQHCGFEDCSLEVFQRELEEIQADGGGDEAESLLSAAFHTMKALNWKQGSTKSLVILTDANFLAPDRDGMTFDEVVALSKRIDPVNFYIITNASYGDDYSELAAATDGKVVTNFEELSLLTDYIMERYDSLPRVEETLVFDEIPVLEVRAVERVSESAVRVDFETTGARTLVALNDAVLGVTDEKSITLTGLDNSLENVLTLVPLGEEVRGESVQVTLDSGYGGSAGVGDEGAAEVVKDTSLLAPVPKVPNTGRR